jgi:hypothetical protein
MIEDRFEEFVRRAAQDYHRPPETPREAMWARIVAERQKRRQWRERRQPGVWARWGLAAAAVLALGIVIGRSTVPVRQARAPVAGASSVGNIIPTAFEVAATDHLRQVETFLTVFRSEAQGPIDHPTGMARELLQNTRLLMDSPAGKDPRLAALLEDIEIVLAQIATFSGNHDRTDLQLIDQGIEQRGLLMKLRAAVPATLGVASAQGVM